MLTKEAFIQTIEERGFYLAKSVLTADFADELRLHLEASYEKENAWHADREHPTYGALLNTALYGGPFLQLLDNDAFVSPFRWFVDEHCIVYSYSSASVPPNQKIYTARIHVDSHRRSPDHHLILGAMIFLTDFTTENGAPYYLAGSHKTAELPEEKYFFEHADKITGQPGDVFYFDPLIWHTGDFNNTNEWRHALTIGFCKPWMKQRFDMPRVLTENGLHTALSEKQLEALGFNAQVPVTYADYYNNTYKHNQKIS